MLTRRKGLDQRTELKRATPLRRTGWKRGGALPVKPRKTGLSSRPASKSPAEEWLRRLLPVRSGGLCEVGVPGVCTGRAQVCSHRKRRSQSRKRDQPDEPAEMWSAANCMAGCLACERHLTDYGATPTVRASGWTVPRGKDPRRVPVLRRGVRVWLTEGGGMEPCTDAEWAAWALETTGEVA